MFGPSQRALVTKDIHPFHQSGRESVTMETQQQLESVATGVCVCVCDCVFYFHQQVRLMFYCGSCRKLVGARYFNQAYQKNAGKVDPSTNSPRDYEGHGTHTLSTAAGNFVGGANVFGFGNGTAKGGSPKARVSAYKVCWPGIQGGCFDGDIMKGFDMAIHDGVDVLSVSLGGEATPFVDYLEDGIAIGAFHAVKNGIVVVCSAGNSGPSESTVSNVAPWMITVGASTIDREFQAYVQLGNGKRLKVPTKNHYFVHFPIFLFIYYVH